MLHFNERARVEDDFFQDYVDTNFSNKKWVPIKRGEINDKSFLQKLNLLKPDFIVCYGCSILSKDAIDAFYRKVVNVHLGLSPYYLGSGTNFHPLADNKPELVGYTLMYIDEGVDTGEIIHQQRPKINVFDNSHHVGCKIIRDMTGAYIELIKYSELLVKKSQPSFEKSKVCYRKDSTEERVSQMYENLKQGMFLSYLKNKSDRDKKYPIIQQSVLL